MLWREIVLSATPGDHRFIAFQKIERAERGGGGGGGDWGERQRNLLFPVSLFSFARAPLRHHMKQARLPSNALTLSAGLATKPIQRDNRWYTEFDANKNNRIYCFTKRKKIPHSFIHRRRQQEVILKEKYKT